jgi:hypothetical protein
MLEANVESQIFYEEDYIQERQVWEIHNIARLLWICSSTLFTFFSLLGQISYR